LLEGLLYPSVSCISNKPIEEAAGSTACRAIGCGNVMYSHTSLCRSIGRRIRS
jgi:hypothetical protein